LPVASPCAGPENLRGSTWKSTHGDITALIEDITRRAPQELQAAVTAETVQLPDGRLLLQAQVCLELPMPEHDADLPRRFGTIQVRRRRIEHTADGTTAVASAHAWQTPRPVALTAGLRDAACDGRLRDSAPQVVAGIDTRAGESGVLAKTTVPDIVPDEGQHLPAAAHAGAEAVSARDPEALRRSVPAPSQDGQDAEPGGPDDAADEAEGAATRDGVDGGGCGVLGRAGSGASQ
jgi:hypothetical protein